MCAVWGVRAAVCVSTSADAGERRRAPRLWVKNFHLSCRKSLEAPLTSFGIRHLSREKHAKHVFVFSLLKCRILKIVGVCLAGGDSIPLAGLGSLTVKNNHLSRQNCFWVANKNSLKSSEIAFQAVRFLLLKCWICVLDGQTKFT